MYSRLTRSHIMLILILIFAWPNLTCNHINPPVGPVLVYPNNVNKQPSSSHHSNGSFGTVFIVLAVIIVISAIACFLGRLCNRRLNSSRPHRQPQHNFRPKKEAGRPDGGGGDHHMEFGRAPSFRAGPKVADGRGSMNHHHNKPHHNGNGEMDHHMKGEMNQHPGGDGEHHVGRGDPRASG
ncbi:hypothetical protein D8674_016393 [Pyrus ussuriensis x Pyrus communis]|uniref:Transmembrane protein n=1 Tax=Pyrus ussuriensis x Pyrus communis TaxID=2448454 RepID=A0A5N5HDT3_9ROSA|nr:hypothetical protein D8674_016393 [Pyrus ussuriensis x Pyrus communis]